MRFMTRVMGTQYLTNFQFLEYSKSWKKVKYCVPITILLVLTGCGGLEWPPQSGASGPVYAKPKSSSSPVHRDTEARRADIPASGVVRVQRGATLFILSRRYGVSARTIIDANDLEPPYRLHQGESLILPRPREHRVAGGETLSGISRRYGVDTYELAKLNRLRPPYRIYVNQRLLLPSSGASDEAVVAAKAEPVTKKNLSGPKTNAPIRRDSEIKPPPKIESVARTPKPRAKPKRPEPPRRYTGRTSGRFYWPVKGRILSSFGAKGEGLQNDGINISAPVGAPVRAAGHGVVAYAGNELRGFGNLLLIKHSGGWVTAYAHNDILLVRRGDKVGKGQVIAKVGKSGNVVSPQLHFEIRKGKRAVNPFRHLRRQSAAGKYQLLAKRTQK